MCTLGVCVLLVCVECVLFGNALGLRLSLAVELWCAETDLSAPVFIDLNLHELTTDGTNKNGLELNWDHQPCRVAFLVQA